MENRFKLRISRMFRSSFGSCRTRNISIDVIEKPTNFSSSSSPQIHHHKNKFHLIEQLGQTPPPLPQPKPARPFPSICKPRRRPESTTQGATVKFLVSTADFDGGRKCPPASPVSPLNLFSHCKDVGFYDKNQCLAGHEKKKKKRRIIKGFVLKARICFLIPHCSAHLLKKVLLIIRITVGRGGQAVKMKQRLFSLQGIISRRIHLSLSGNNILITEKSATLVGEELKTGVAVSKERMK